MTRYFNLEGQHLVYKSWVVILISHLFIHFKTKYSEFPTNSPWSPFDNSFSNLCSSLFHNFSHIPVSGAGSNAAPPTKRTTTLLNDNNLASLAPTLNITVSRLLSLSSSSTYSCLQAKHTKCIILNYIWFE
jgi:hypothetical protein